MSMKRCQHLIPFGAALHQRTNLPPVPVPDRSVIMEGHSIAIERLTGVLCVHHDAIVVLGHRNFPGPPRRAQAVLVHLACRGAFSRSLRLLRRCRLQSLLVLAMLLLRRIDPSCLQVSPVGRRIVQLPHSRDMVGRKRVRVLGIRPHADDASLLHLPLLGRNANLTDLRCIFSAHGSEASMRRQHCRSLRAKRGAQSGDGARTWRSGRPGG
mmetsp:Transcript_7330/g.16033  ORF Transcript_7330/g.16033 Transcript_7330/m.16033 type:complete len:211 (-) Transcript_7330:27-659(-)